MRFTDIYTGSRLLDAKTLWITQFSWFSFISISKIPKWREFIDVRYSERTRNPVTEYLRICSIIVNINPLMRLLLIIPSQMSYTTWIKSLTRIMKRLKQNTLQMKIILNNLSTFKSYMMLTNRKPRSKTINVLNMMRTKI